MSERQERLQNRLQPEIREFRDGCRNEGVIGRYLEPEERYALIEYLKVMGNEQLESQLQPAESRAWTPGPSCQNNN